MLPFTERLCGTLFCVLEHISSLQAHMTMI